MSVKNELLKMIDERYQKFSKGQKNWRILSVRIMIKRLFLTAAKMGEEVGVSESTVVRFATALGYDGYPEFQKALGELVRMKLNSIQRMEVTYGRISQGRSLLRFCIRILRRSSLRWKQLTMRHLKWR